MCTHARTHTHFLNRLCSWQPRHSLTADTPLFDLSSSAVRQWGGGSCCCLQVRKWIMVPKIGDDFGLIFSLWLTFNSKRHTELCIIHRTWKDLLQLAFIKLIQYKNVKLYFMFQFNYFLHIIFNTNVWVRVLRIYILSFSTSVWPMTFCFSKVIMKFRILLFLFKCHNLGICIVLFCS